MKKKTIASLVALLTCVGVGLWLWLGRGKAELKNAIPTDATLVARIDWAKLNEAIDLGDSFSQADYGIDFSAPAYAFVSDGYVGALVSLKSKAKLTQALGVNTEQQRGMEWGAVDQMMVCIYNNMALLLGPVAQSEQAELRNQVYRTMTQKQGSTLADRLDDSSQAVALCVTPDALPEDYRKKAQAFLPKDILAVGGLTLNDNHLRLDLTLEAAKPEAEKALSLVREAFPPIKGALVTPDTTDFVHAELGVDGTQLLNLLRQNPEVRTMLLMANMVADVDMVVKSIKGDVAIRMPQLSTIDTELTLVAEISTSSFLDQVIEWGDEASTQGSIRFIPSVNGAYLCAYGGKAYYFGATDEHLYITNKAEDINPTFATYTPEGERLRISADLTSVADLLTFVPALSSLQTLRQVTITLR